jgi:hypothetical protein
MFKQWLREYLGFTHLADYIAEAAINIRDLQKQTDAIDRKLSVITPGLGRVIAKLDPMFAESELSPERKAESDRIGEEVINRLNAEAKAREPYND